jgi:aminoglycoside phosphotransferase (APT) family kinase protein
MIVARVSSPAVADGLLEYLRARFRLDRATYAEPPKQSPNGWETYIYHFRLAKQDGLPARFTAPLVLRLYASRYGLTRLRHEFAVQQHMASLNYPCARPLLLEEDSVFFGGPFMLMEHVDGCTLVDLLLARPWKIYRGPARMADLHIWLHRLPVIGFPAPSESLLPRSFREMDQLLDEHDLSGLRPGLEWLVRHRPPDPERPVPLHLDFHPLNLMFDGNRCTGVLDWCEADVGDRHADVATTMLLFKSVSLDWQGLWQNVAHWPGRFLLLQGYLEAYHQRLPLERTLLRYYYAWAALRRLCKYGRWLRASPISTGSKPSLLEHLSAAGIDRLSHCFRRWSGVNVTLG